METEAQQLANVRESIPDFKTAYHIADQAVRSHHRQWKIFRAVEDHIGGQKPIPPAELKKKGLDWSNNWNYGKARSQIEKNVAEGTNRVATGLMVGSPEFRLYEDSDRGDDITGFLENAETRGSVSTILGYCFFRALEEEGNLYHWIQKVEFNAITFSYCPISFHSKGWKPDPVKLTRIAFEPGSTTEEVDTWVVFRSEKAIHLYDTYTRIKNKKAAQSEDPDAPKLKFHWNEKALEKVLIKLFRGRDENGGEIESWDEIAPMYNQNPGYIVAQTEDLNMACIYRQELDGSITVVYIPWGYKWCNPETIKLGNIADDTPEIIYKRNYGGKDKDYFIRFVRDASFAEVDDIHDMRGLGKIAVENSIRYNRLRNSLNNKSQLIGSPMFEQPSTQTKEKFKVTHSQGFTLLSPGYVPLERQPSYDINSHLVIVSHENNEFKNVTSGYDVDASGRLSSRPTSDEVRLAQAEVSQLQSAKDMVKFRDYAGVFYEMLKRMATPLSNKEDGHKARRKFFKLLKEHLLFINTDEDCVNLINLVVGYSIDIVNTEMESLQLAMQLAETPYARNRIKRLMMISNGFSIREVNNAIPVIVDRFRAFDDTRVAAIENDMFWTTTEVVFQATDDHVVHYEFHVQKMDSVFEQLRQQQLDIVQSYDYVVRLYAHIMLHIDELSRDPVLKGQAEDWLDEMRERKRTIDQIAYARNREIQAREEAARQNNPGISPKDQHDMRLKQAQAEAQESRNQFKTKSRYELKVEEEKNRHERELIKIQNNHEEKLAELRNESQRNSQAS